jgi:hypothetical protein
LIFYTLIADAGKILYSVSKIFHNFASVFVFSHVYY